MNKTTALQRRSEAQEDLTTAATEADKHAQRRDQWLAKAQSAGASYADLRKATGLSTSRLTQLLRRSRTNTTQEK